MGIIKNNPTINKPVNTRNTAVQVCGVRWCVKIQHRTRTCITRLGNTAALLGFTLAISEPQKATPDDVQA
jgi:hypothetical protein